MCKQKSTKCPAGLDLAGERASRSQTSGANALAKKDCETLTA